MNRSNYKWYVIGMLWCVCFFDYVDRWGFSALFPLFKKEMHLTPVQLGMLGSVSAWIYGLGAPFAGYVVDRIRRKTAILGGLFIWSSITAAAVLAHSFHQLLLFMAALGAAVTIYMPSAMSMISDYHGRATRSRAMGFHQTAVYVGTIGGGFLAGFIGERYGWRWAFVTFGASGAVLGMILLGLLREPERGAADLEDGSAAPQAHPVERASVGTTIRAGSGHAHRRAADGRVHVRELCRSGFAGLDAELSLREIPYERGHGGTFRHAFRADRQHGGVTARWLAGRHFSPQARGRPGADPGGRGILRSALRILLRPGGDHDSGHRHADGLGFLQRSLRRQHFRFGLRRYTAAGARDGRRLH